MPLGLRASPLPPPTRRLVRIIEVRLVSSLGGGLYLVVVRVIAEDVRNRVGEKHPAGLRVARKQGERLCSGLGPTWFQEVRCDYSGRALDTTTS